LDAKEYLTFFTGYNHNTDTIVYDTSESQFDTVTHMELKRIVREIVTKLSSKEEFVLRRRFGFDNDNPMSLEDLGKLLGGITRERVRQIEQRAY
jgi:RNA polymerase primary sigma factor